MKYLKKLKKDAAAGCKIVSGESPIMVESVGTPVIVIESLMSDLSGTTVVERVFIDPPQMLPVQWDLFEKGKFQSRSKFQNYRINAHWDDSQFSM